jgi:hypothetical protein
VTAAGESAQAYKTFLAAAKKAGFNLEEVNPSEARRHGAFLATSGEQPVPFWTGAEDPRNREIENEVIEHFRCRPNTLSVRDVRDAHVPWSIEVVGRKRGDIQHIRILCEHDVTDVLNLPFETHREAKDGYAETDGYGRNRDVDFLLFVCARSLVLRLVGRDRFEQFVLKAKRDFGVNYPFLKPRKVPNDNFGRSAFGQLVPILDLEDAGVILDTWHMDNEE